MLSVYSMYFVRQPSQLPVPFFGRFLKFCATQIYPCEIPFTCHILSSLLIVFWHELQYHLHLCFLSSISNIASYADLWQYFSILLISRFFMSLKAPEIQTTFFVLSSPSINFVPLIAFKTADGFAEHFKINLPFTVGLNF